MSTQPSGRLHAQTQAQQALPVLKESEKAKRRVCTPQPRAVKPDTTLQSVTKALKAGQSKLFHDTVLAALLISPAAFAKEPASGLQGSSAASDLLARRSRKATGPAEAPKAPPQTAASSPVEASPQPSASAVESASGRAADATSLDSSSSTITGSPQGAADQATSAASRLQESASTSGSSLQEGASDLANSVQSSAESVLGKRPSIEYPSGTSRQAGSAARDVSKQASEAADRLSHQAQDALQGLNSAAGDATAGARKALSEVGSSVSVSLQQLGDQLGGAASSAKAALPAPIQQAIDAATPGVDAAIHQVQRDSRLSAAAVALGIGLPTVLWFRARYGGYGGPLSANETFAALQEEDAIWVDLRPDEQREADGVAELKRGARRKATVVPLVKLPLELSRQLRRPNEVADSMTAAQIASLTQVSGSTKIILVDDRGKDAIRVARRMRQFGRAKAYVLEGGFKAWLRQGLPVREGSLYGTSVLETFSDDVEVFAENANAFVRNPAALVALLGAVGGTGAVIYDYHKTLQFLGIFGLLITALWRYNSIKELTQDLLGGLKNIGKAADTVATTVPAIASAGSSTLRSGTSALQDASSPSPARSSTAALPQSTATANGSKPSDPPEPAFAAEGLEASSAAESSSSSPAAPPEKTVADSQPSTPAVESRPSSKPAAGQPTQSDGSEKAAEKAQPQAEKRLDESAGRADKATPVPSESAK